MRFTHFIRQFHRCLSISVTVFVVVVFIAVIDPAPPERVFYLPLPALALMLLSGLYLFAQPYLRKGSA